MPFVDVKKDDPAWESIQRIGLTGMLKADGKSEGWANKSFFYPDSLVKPFELSTGLRQYYRAYYFPMRKYWVLNSFDSKSLDYFLVIQKFRDYFKQDWFRTVKGPDQLKSLWEKWGLTNYDPQRPITRKELAVMFDKCLLLFGSKNQVLDINGQLQFKLSEF